MYHEVLEFPDKPPLAIGLSLEMTYIGLPVRGLITFSGSKFFFPDASSVKSFPEP